MQPNNEKIFEDLMRAYRLKGKIVSVAVLRSGNVNDTYTVVTDYNGSERQYIAQRVNLHVFREPLKVAENIAAVTKHIESKLIADGVTDLRRRVVKFYQIPGEGYYYYDPDGGCWRVSSFIFNSVTVNDANTPFLLYETGSAFGEFQRLLADFRADELNVTIPDFHNTEKRLENLIKAAGEDKFGRLCELREDCDFLLSLSDYAPFFSNELASGRIPLRVTHNDTKCNNIMFDRTTGGHLAVIDLDTVMPGFAAHDFGDAVRFAANPAGEDCDDPSRVRLDLESYRHIARGFIPQVRGLLNERELETLPEGVLVITYELAMRFMTDYLEGDVYFKCKKEKHNLIRARAQTALLRDITAKMPQLHSILGDVVENA